MPKFSIIVPIFKVEQYLERCIDSLVNQTLKDIEIILVDDGSPDRCPEICDNYAKQDRRIKVIHKKNGGVSAARNDGLALAKGEWVIFCDSDDWMELDACESLYNTGVSCNADIVIADIYRVNGNKRNYCKLFANAFEFTQQKDIEKVILSVIYQRFCMMTPEKPQFGLGGPWNKAIRREIITENSICFDTDLMGVYDDRLFILNAYTRAKKIVYIHKAVYNYVLIEDSITRAYKANILEVNIRIFNKFNNFIRKNFSSNPTLNEAYNAMVVNRLHDALRLYFFSKKNQTNWAEKREKLKKVLETEPYRTAIQNISADKLHKHLALALKIMKINSPELLWLLFKMKEIKSTVTNNL